MPDELLKVDSTKDNLIEQIRDLRERTSILETYPQSESATSTPGISINVMDYGALGNGVTDDLAAINKAFEVAISTTIGSAMTVDFPAGTYMVSDTVNIPNKVIVRGSGPIARTGTPGSTIKAMTGYSGSYVVQLGGDASNSVYCRLENMGVHGNNIAGLTGVYSNSINEESGLIRCTVSDCDVYGIHMDNSATGLCRNYLLRDLYVLHVDGASGAAIGVYIHGGSSPQRGIDGLTVGGEGAALDVDLQIDACIGAVFERIHLENAADGILIGPNTGNNALTFIGITGHSSLTDLIHIVDNSNSNLQFIGLYKNSATNVINDVQSGFAHTQSYIGFYGTGDVISVGGNKTILDLWYQDNVAASQTAVVLSRYGSAGGAPAYGANSWFAPRAGSILGIAVRSNAARSAGTLTVEVYKNSTTATGLTAVLDGTNTTFHSTYQKHALDAFAAGDWLVVKITTDGSWAPTTADIRVIIEVEM